MGQPLKGPLTGIRVVDMSVAVSGPHAGMLLADLGAEVIKIEAPVIGDNLRRVNGPGVGKHNFYFIAENANKKSVELDLSIPSGKECFFDLVRVSDVVIHNHRPGSLERLGCDYPALSKINPRIILGRIHGYGSGGPGDEWPPCYDLIAQAMSGMVGICGEPGRPPLKVPFEVADLATGNFAAMAIITALYAREKTGKGQEVHVSLLDSAISMMEGVFSHYFCDGVVPQPQGSGSINLAPWGVYPTKDGHITLGSCWPRIARVIDMEWLADDPRFATMESRYEHRKELDELLSAGLRQQTTETWVELMHVEDIPAGPVLKVNEVPAFPQVVHNKIFRKMRDPDNGLEYTAVANPIQMAGVEGQYQPPPDLGQHNRHVLGGILGYSDEKIDSIIAEGRAHTGELSEHISRSL